MTASKTFTFNVEEVKITKTISSIVETDGKPTVIQEDRPYLELRLINEFGQVAHRARGATREACMIGLKEFGYTVEE